MALPEITQEEILARRAPEDRSVMTYDAVMIVNPECAGCADWESQIEGIVATYQNINFHKLIATDETLPVCAPPVVPSILGFENGYRMWEALGAHETTGPFEVMLDDWMNGQIDISTVSGGTFIVPE